MSDRETTSDPIADFKRAVDMIERSTGQMRPSYMLLPRGLPRQMVENDEKRLALAERILGVGLDENGKPRTSGILWSRRQGRRSKRRKDLLWCIDVLPERIRQGRIALGKYERGEITWAQLFGGGSLVKPISPKGGDK